MTEALTKLKNVRQGHRASTTRLLTQIPNVITEGSTPKLLQHQATLQEKMDTLKKLDDEILGLFGPEPEAAIEEESRCD